MTGSARQRKFWTAARTRSAEERRAAFHAENLGFEWKLFEMPNWRFGKEAPGRQLMFPGWIFVRVAPSGGWQVLHSTRGFSRLVLCGDLPVRVPDAELAALTALEDDAGLVRLEPRLSDGDSVRVGAMGGAYSGLSGIVQGTPARDCARVLFELLGKQVSVRLPTHCLQPGSAEGIRGGPRAPLAAAATGPETARAS